MSSPQNLIALLRNRADGTPEKRCLTYYQATNAYDGPLVSWAPMHHLTGLRGTVVQPINIGCRA